MKKVAAFTMKSMAKLFLPYVLAPSLPHLLLQLPSGSCVLSDLQVGEIMDFKWLFESEMEFPGGCWIRCCSLGLESKSGLMGRHT